MSGEPATAPVDAEAFKAGMRCLASGVTIITTIHDGQRAGLTATAVCSLSVDPPQLLVCVSHKAEAHDIIHRGSVMCVNLLARQHQGLAARFAGQTGVSGAARFGEGAWCSLCTGAPVLDDAVASFDCVVAERVESATHSIFIGRVVDVRVRPDLRPLIYAGGGYAELRTLEIEGAG
jgi:flavin reductase (DIM6/NTAB) family NADH-FMN oxidoreductase RutF